MLLVQVQDDGYGTLSCGSSPCKVSLTCCSQHAVHALVATHNKGYKYIHIYTVFSTGTVCIPIKLTDTLHIRHFAWSQLALSIFDHILIFVLMLMNVYQPVYQVDSHLFTFVVYKCLAVVWYHYLLDQISMQILIFINHNVLCHSGSRTRTPAPFIHLKYLAQH